ncbi:MAG: hypothetical protein AAFR87_07465 [Bacteroidota bacterium]
MRSVKYYSRRPYGSLLFSWLQIAGPLTNLSATNTDRPSFIPHQCSEFYFDLRVSDEDADDLDTVKVSVSELGDFIKAYWPLDEGMGQLSTESLLEIYPNPVEELLKVYADFEAGTAYQIWDISRRLHIELPYQRCFQLTHFSLLPPESYFLQQKNEAGDSLGVSRFLKVSP